MPDEILNEEEQEEVTTPVNEDPEPTPAPPTISDRVKLALRISHNLLDAEITQVITSARQELERAGVSHEVAYSDLELVETAIITYAKSGKKLVIILGQCYSLLACKRTRATERHRAVKMQMQIYKCIFFCVYHKILLNLKLTCDILFRAEY